LATTPKLHSVNFRAYAIEAKALSDAVQSLREPLTQLSNITTGDAVNAAAGVAQATVNGTIAVVNGGSSLPDITVNSVINGLQSGVDSAAESGIKINSAINSLNKISRSTIAKDSITLYMPDNVQFSYAAQYGNLSIAEALESVPLVKGVAKAITSTIGKEGNAAARLLLNAAGYVFNPQQQVLFEGIDFREYSMTFTFTPFNKQESDEVAQIIKSFRKNAAPTIVKATGGFFFNPPAVFDITYLFNSALNNNISQVKRSVLKNVDVNYAPNGWATHEDGSPVQIVMSLNFQEIELVDSADIENGY
jgi:hypothetical protein